MNTRGQLKITAGHSCDDRMPDSAICYSVIDELAWKQKYTLVGNSRFMAALDAGCASAGCANAGCARSCRPHW